MSPSNRKAINDSLAGPPVKVGAVILRGIRAKMKS